MKKRVFITGIGCILGEEMKDNGKYYEIKEDQYEEIISQYKLNSSADRFSRYCIAATKLALRDAELMDECISEDCSMVFGTAYGPLSSIHRFDTVSVEKGALFVNPSQFPNTVLNSPACRTGIQFNISGPVYTLCNGITSSLDAIGLGYCQVKNGITSFVIAGGGDEVSELQLEVHRSQRTMIEGCGFVLLESKRCKSKRSNALEILGYDNFSFYIENIEQMCSEMSHRIEKLVKEAGDSQYSSANLSIYSSLCDESVMEISKGTRERLDFKITNKEISKDFIGAGGVVQVFDIMKEDDYRDNEENLHILLNIDESKATILLLSKCIK